MAAAAVRSKDDDESTDDAYARVVQAMAVFDAAHLDHLTTPLRPATSTTWSSTRTSRTSRTSRIRRHPGTTERAHAEGSSTGGSPSVLPSAAGCRSPMRFCDLGPVPGTSALFLLDTTSGAATDTWAPQRTPSPWPGCGSPPSSRTACTPASTTSDRSSARPHLGSGCDLTPAAATPAASAGGSVADGVRRGPPTTSMRRLSSRSPSPCPCGGPTSPSPCGRSGCSPQDWPSRSPPDLWPAAGSATGSDAHGCSPSI